MSEDMFRSFFLAGFECSTHRLHSGRRLDLVAATAHDTYAAADYVRLLEQGIRAAREGIRWHRIETRPGHHDFSCELNRIRAARDAGIQVIWDLCHYGWPDDLDPFQPEFVDRFAALAGAFARLLASETDDPPWVLPVNEISFMAWIAGSVGLMNPFAHERGDELKAQLVRTAIAGIEAVWDVDSRARVVHAEPLIHVVADPAGPDTPEDVARYREAQFHAWDAIAGRSWPELGGHPKYLDVIGVNYYPQNQWVHTGRVLHRSDPQYLPLRELLREVWERYRRPFFIAETGTEDEARPEWLHYIARETHAALRSGVPVEGICWYPILNHPGWDNDRHCHNGLWDYVNEQGGREIYAPLADELQEQRHLFTPLPRPAEGTERSSATFTGEKRTSAA